MSHRDSRNSLLIFNHADPFIGFEFNSNAASAGISQTGDAKLQARTRVVDNGKLRSNFVKVAIESRRRLEMMSIKDEDIPMFLCIRTLSLTHYHHI